MQRSPVGLLIFSSVWFAYGCGGASPVANSNKAAAYSNTNTNVSAQPMATLDPANMPPGLSASPVNLPANVPGIPSNAGKPLPKGTTPTPGIPSPEELKKPFKPGTTPTPGIPSPEEIRRMMGQPANIKTAPPGNTQPMMKKKPTPTP